MPSLITRSLVVAATSLILLAGCAATPPAPTGGADKTPAPTASTEQVEPATLPEACDEFRTAFQAYAASVEDENGETTLPALSTGTTTLGAVAGDIALRLEATDGPSAAAFAKVSDTAAVLVDDLDNTDKTVDTYDFESGAPKAYSESMQALTKICTEP